MCQGICRPDIIKNRFISKIEKKRQFVGLIPFVRNLIEYTDGASSTDYILLTSCLHQKPDTESIKIETIYDVFKSHLSGLADKNISFIDEKYTDVLFGEAEAVLYDTNEVELANKLILSMAIRLKAETLMKSIVSEEHQAEMKPNSNQTGELLKFLKKYYADTYPDVCLLMNRVVMLTSENIHVNNFMLEPLVDISSLHLKKLYEDVCNQIKTYEYKTTNNVGDIHNAVSRKEKKIRPVWFFFLLLLFFASCQEEEKKTIVCWGDSLTSPHQETLKQKIRGIFVEDHDYPFILAHDVTINSKDCALENFMGNTDVPAFLSSYNNEVCYPLPQHKSSTKINDCMIQGALMNYLCNKY